MTLWISCFVYLIIQTSFHNYECSQTDEECYECLGIASVRDLS